MGWRGVMSETRGDEYVFHFSMPNRLSDRYPGRGVLNTPHIDSTSTPAPSAGRLVGCMQYVPTLLAEKSDLKDWWGVMFETMGDKPVFHSSMSNRLSDRYPGRAQKHTPLARLLSTLSSLTGRLMRRKQYAPTLPEKEEVSSGRCFLLSRTIRDKFVFLFSTSNQLSDRYPCRGVLHTPLIDSTSTHSPLAGHLVGHMQYAPTLSEKDEVSVGMCFLLSRTMADKYVFHLSMSNRLSDRCPCRGVLHTPLARLSSTPTPFAGRLVGRMQYAPTLSKKDEVFSGKCFLSSRTVRD